MSCPTCSSFAQPIDCVHGLADHFGARQHRTGSSQSYISRTHPLHLWLGTVRSPARAPPAPIRRSLWCPSAAHWFEPESHWWGAPTAPLAVTMHRPARSPLAQHLGARHCCPTANSWLCNSRRSVSLSHPRRSAVKAAHRVNTGSSSQPTVPNRATIPNRAMCNGWQCTLPNIPNSAI